jgi:DNA-directed RNA polymerase subunit delta
MGGHQVQGHGSGDDGWEEEGYDESQRAEILEATRDGPTDGTVLTDLDPDLMEDDQEEPADELDMVDDEVGETDDDADMTEEDMDEDDAQEDFEDETMDDEELDDGDDVATRP